MKQYFIDQLKNIPGWHTNRKFLVISVDDYGNVRLDSKKARDNMDNAGLNVNSRFDAYDTLETREDLEALYEVLTSVKDKNGKCAVFTPFALPCNINFEKMAEEDYRNFHYELLPETYRKLSELQDRAYSGTWALWQEGIQKGIMVPQFHGREHLNIKVLEEKLAKRDFEVLTALENRSYTSISDTGYNTISFSAAFDFWEYKENERFKEIVVDGLNHFEEVFGYRSEHFNPPGGREHSDLHVVLKENGIKYLDNTLFKKEHLGRGKYKKSLNYTGKRNKLGMLYQVRNVVFEPTFEDRTDWVGFALKQIESAFRWNKPAIISSHRVNFCGHIDPKVRKKGVSALNELLGKIIWKWPDVEFISSVELGRAMDATVKK